MPRAEEDFDAQNLVRAPQVCEVRSVWYADDAVVILLILEETIVCSVAEHDVAQNMIGKSA